MQTKRSAWLIILSVLILLSVSVCAAFATSALSTEEAKQILQNLGGSEDILVVVTYTDNPLRVYGRTRCAPFEVDTIECHISIKLLNTFPRSWGIYVLLHEYAHYIWHDGPKDSVKEYGGKQEEYSADIWALEHGCDFGLRRIDFEGMMRWDALRRLDPDSTSTTHGTPKERAAYVLKHATECPGESREPTIAIPGA